ncbi:glycosyltransferase [Segatella paludivivens]|uniref:glycosyltransferase n=1 Tax=Segatella paludivivens TaxID=185294 RepID=UPI00036C25E3|nr:glycosyltransferase [Segatella paludivivens]
MKKNIKNILIISSANPESGPGVLARDAKNALENDNLNVDVLTLFEVENHSEYKYILKNNKFCLFTYKLYQRLLSIIPKQFGPYFLFYKNENCPPVPSSLVIKSIKREYDLVLIKFWQGMLSYKTVFAIHKKIKCPIFFECVDYGPFAGGCHFPGNCQRYKIGCGKCPAICSSNENDFTHFNFLFRKKVIKEINPLIIANTYMFKWFNQSEIMNGLQHTVSFPIILEDIFKPMDRNLLRIKYCIPENKQFILFFGSQSITDERKGMSFLIEAFDFVSAKLTKDECSKFYLLVAGNESKEILNKLNFEGKGLGFLQTNDLAEIYALSDSFLSPSINDAGPMMVNQSISCGTPVISFEMGTCIDSVKDKNTGFLAPLKDSEAFAECIIKMFRLSPEEKKNMRECCRLEALKTTSKKAYVDSVKKSYNDYNERIRKMI